MGKKLKRSRKERWIAGICGGIAEHLDIDPLLVRILWAAGTVITGGPWGFIVYVVLIFVIEEE